MAYTLPIDVSKLPDQFGGYVAGTTLIADGDGPAYVAAATAKTLPTAIRRYQQRILELKFLTQTEHCRVHLTAQDSYKMGRFLIRAAKPYQGNRVGKDKPPLLEALRMAIASDEHAIPEYTVFMNRTVEADDAMIIDAYRYKDNGVIWSEDKDLRMTPYPYWDAATAKVLPSAGFGWVDVGFTKGGNPKPVGHGLKFFWLQMLMGDSADNIQGLKKLDGKLCGPALAYNSIRSITSQDDVANFIFDGYRKIDQNPLPEAWLLWLTRWPGDSCWKYFEELNLSPQNQDFLKDCLQRNWYDTDVT